MNKGKVIAVVGGPRSGKSFLVNLLAKHYGVTAILEGEEQDFPERIREDIQQNIRPLERIVWFRNKLVKEYFQALEMKKQEQIVVIDNFWISYQLYIDALAKDFEGQIVHDIALIDRQTLEWPDLIVLLSLSEDGIRDFVKRGGRKFDNNEDFIRNQALPIHKLHNDFFSREDIKGRVILLQRDDLDFSRESDFNDLLEKINDKK